MTDQKDIQQNADSTTESSNRHLEHEVRQLAFSEFKEETAKDCEEVAKWLNELAKNIRDGDMKAFEKFWIEGGTEEGDAKIADIHQRIVLRYLAKQEQVA